MPAYLRHRLVLALILVIVYSVPAIQSGRHGSSSTVPDAGAASYTGKVVAITDGDTIKVMHTGRPERVRLWGIDCPESHQAFGTRAKQSASRLAFGSEVKVVVRDTGRYGRTLGEVTFQTGAI
jgi:endonuclease YncB( thermonuclease family)